MSFLSIFGLDFCQGSWGLQLHRQKRERKTADAERMCFTMKSTGIVRRVDELGRIVLPIELRRTLNIAEKDSLEIYVDGSSIMLKKYQPACIFCDSAKDISVFKGKNICAHCLKELLQK